MSRQPKPGEWWFSPDGQERRFFIGRDGDGDEAWHEETEGYSARRCPGFVPVPDCDSWDWELPAMPIGWELCGPPKDAWECTVLRVWFDDCWYACRPENIDDDARTYCRRPKSADLGPQKEPSSVARITAQLRQVLMDLEELEVSDVEHDTQRDS